MRIAVIVARRWKTAATGILCVAAGALLLCFPQAAAGGVSRGLALCGQMLIPSLFPFLVLSGLVVRSGLAAALGRRLSPLTSRLFGLPGCAAAALLISLCGGYPAGGAAVAELMEGGYLRREEGKRLLRCCVNGGPAFVLCGVGAGMLGSVRAGALLLIAHLLASLLVALLERRKTDDTPLCASPHAAAQPLCAAFVGSVQSAVEALISMCGFVLLAAAAVALFDASGTADGLFALLAAPFRLQGLEPRFLHCLLPSAVEVSCGCVEAAALGESAPFWLGAALGWGGLSVHGQVAARVSRHRLIDAGFFRARALHALLGGTLSALLFWLFPVPRAAVAASAQFAVSSLPSSGIVGTVALLMMCVLFLCTLTPRECEQK